MATFHDIIGQEPIKQHMQNAIRTRQVSHAYIIQGERDSGKEFVAQVFAMALQCERGDGEPCQECHSCKQALSHNHPDIIRVTPEKPNTIGVEDIRAQVNRDIAIRPYSSPRKIYLIGDAEKMTVQAQNALLKTLEEPPEYAVILLLTANLDALLPTILSRCVTLSMKPVPDELVRQFLLEELQAQEDRENEDAAPEAGHVPAAPNLREYKAKVCAAFAHGNIGKAKKLALNEEFDHIREEAVTLLKYIGEMEIGEITAAIKNIKNYQMDINDYLDLLAVWYRDVLLFKATNDANHLIFREEIQYIRKAANRSAYEGIERIIDALDKAKSRLSANVNFELTMELLLLTIKENS